MKIFLLSILIVFFMLTGKAFSNIDFDKSFPTDKLHESINKSNESIMSNKKTIDDYKEQIEKKEEGYHFIEIKQGEMCICPEDLFVEFKWVDEKFDYEAEAIHFIMNLKYDQEIYSAKIYNSFVNVSEFMSPKIKWHVFYQKRFYEISEEMCECYPLTGKEKE